MRASARASVISGHRTVVQLCYAFYCGSYYVAAFLICHRMSFPDSTMASAAFVTLWSVLCVVWPATGTVIQTTPGEHVILQCPCHPRAITWYKKTGTSSHDEIFTYYSVDHERQGEVVSVMHEPWDSRGWRCDVTSGTLYIPKVQPEDAGHYNCRYCSQSSIDLRVGDTVVPSYGNEQPEESAPGQSPAQVPLPANQCGECDETTTRPGTAGGTNGLARGLGAFGGIIALLLVIVACYVGWRWRRKRQCLIDADTEEFAQFDRWMLWRHSWKQENLVKGDVTTTSMGNISLTSKSQSKRNLKEETSPVMESYLKEMQNKKEFSPFLHIV